ncbi:hypothetical protein PSAC2689_80084 [Paraburkholderia sacchari]
MAAGLRRMVFRLVHSAHRTHPPNIMNTISLTFRPQRSFTPYQKSTACQGLFTLITGPGPGSAPRKA